MIMKKYIFLLLLLSLIYSLSFSFNIGVALDKNVDKLALVSDSTLVMNNSLGKALISFSPLRTINIKYYSKGKISINGKIFSLPLSFYSTMGLISVDGVKYRNKIFIVQGNNGFTVVNSLDSEDFISDVMMNFPHNLQIETYKAISISLRSLLYSLRKLYPNDLYFITKNNKYFPYNGYATPSPLILVALKYTRSKVLFYKGLPAYTYYSYDSGGITSSAKEIFGYTVGYLKAVPSPFGSDGSQFSQWSYYYSDSRLSSILSSMVKGNVLSLKILSRTESGRVAYLYVRTNYKSYKITGKRLYDRIGRTILPSLLFSIYRHGSGYKFVGKGYGTGLGLPIYDANAFAEKGYTYVDILSHFYPNTELKELK
jgi:stage II sporulation protein D